MFRFRQVATAFILAGIVPLLLTGCAGTEGLKAGMRKSITTPAPPASPIVEKMAVKADEAPPSPAPANLDYEVGVGDVLAVMVYGRPDLSTGVTATGLTTTAAIATRGSRVDGSGNIHLPLAGTVRVSGLSVKAIGDSVEISLSRFVKEPSVVVEVMEYRSKPIYLMGQFRTPGVYYMDRPMTFLQGITLGNGFDTSANLRGVRMLRDKKIAPVDVYSLILDGRIEQNVWLRPGDTIFLPDNRTQNVFVFGAVNKPGPILMPQGRMNLLEAIAAADPRSVGSRLEHVRIIRSLTTTTGELLVVDVERIRRGETLSMQLIEGDVVYVPKNAFGSWNDAIAEILPSLQAVSALLQPFVQIKFLSEND
jgi:polysaccharide export outer membrane protein